MYERARQLGLSVHIEHTESLTITYHIGDQYFSTASGPTKHAAKQIAAKQMLDILPLPEEKVRPKHNRKHNHQHKKFIEQKGSTNYSLTEEINPITRLYQIARAREEKIEFTQIKDSEMRIFFIFM